MTEIDDRVVSDDVDGKMRDVGSDLERLGPELIARHHGGDRAVVREHLRGDGLGGEGL